MDYQVVQKKDGRYYPQVSFLFFWWKDCIDLGSENNKPASFDNRADAEQYVVRNYLNGYI